MMMALQTSPAVVAKPNARVPASGVDSSVPFGAS